MLPNLRRAAAPALSTLALLLAGCAQTPPPAAPVAMPAFPAEAAPAATPCPKELPAGSRCLAGTDHAGAHYLIAVPPQWSGTLVLHAHGGPLLGAPRADRVAEDLSRWAVVVQAGHAWAGSSYAQGGVAVRAAATDTERLRRIFLAHVARPKRTVLHGQSWGASVAAVGASMFTAGRPYDAVLLTSGVLGGGTRSYDFRLDLRVIYQQLCGNHPRPTEPAYPLWMGLPAGSKMSGADLQARTRECLGLGLPAAQRTPEQARKLAVITRTLQIPERQVQGHLNWATFHFRDLADRYGERPVFGNRGAQYRGSDDDAGLNAAVDAAGLRYTADPAAVAAFAADADPDGRIPVPVLTVKGVHDPIAFVELDHRFAQTMAAAGRADALVQTFTDDAEHSFLSAPVYPALIDALEAWVARGEKPTPDAVAARCEALKPRFGEGCRFLTAFRPAPLDTRVTPRLRP
jgi:hypothetical protein